LFLEIALLPFKKKRNFKKPTSLESIKEEGITDKKAEKEFCSVTIL